MQLNIKALFVIVSSFLFFHLTVLSQGEKADSLRVIAETAKDADKPALYNALAALYRQSNPDKTIEYSGKALEYSQTTGNEKEEGQALSNIGYAWFVKGDYSKATDNIKMSIELGKRLNDNKLLGADYNVLGLIEENAGKLNKALDNFLQALQYREAIQDSAGMAATDNNLGDIYRIFKKTEKALEYLHKAEILYTAIGNKNGLGSAKSNIGVAYLQVNDYPNAMKYLQEAFTLRKETHNNRGLSIVLANLADASMRMNKPADAIGYLKQSLEISKAVGEPLVYAESRITMAQAYEKMDSLTTAEKNVMLAIDTASLLKMRPQLQAATQLYADILYKQGHADKAYTYLKQSLDLKDSMFNNESQEKIMTLQDQIDKQREEADAKIKEESDKRQKTVLTLGIVFLIIVAGFLLIGFRIQRKSNLKLEERNKLIAQKNKEIGESIDYAKRIQTAVLPLVKDLMRVFPDGFGVYIPKDIVSGDFYWFAENGDKKYIAAADCTGHGVPGAFMSMLGSDKLTASVNFKNNLKPGDILSDVNNEIRTTLKQTEAAEGLRDGMDIALCCYDLNKNILEYAGANRPLYHLRNGKLTEYAPEKMAIGGFTTSDYHYTTHSIELKKGDTIFIFSDGYTDQFGGEKGKKFSTRKFKELLVSINPKTMDEQEKILNKTIREWMNYNGTAYEQLDDILVVGIRV